MIRMRSSQLKFSKFSNLTLVMNLKPIRCRHLPLPCRSRTKWILQGWSAIWYYLLIKPKLIRLHTYQTFLDFYFNTRLLEVWQILGSKPFGNLHNVIANQWFFHFIGLPLTLSIYRCVIIVDKGDRQLATFFCHQQHDYQIIVTTFQSLNQHQTIFKEFEKYFRILFECHVGHWDIFQSFKSDNKFKEIKRNCKSIYLNQI